MTHDEIDQGRKRLSTVRIVTVSSSFADTLVPPAPNRVNLFMRWVVSGNFTGTLGTSPSGNPTISFGTGTNFWLDLHIDTHGSAVTAAWFMTASIGNGAMLIIETFEEPCDCP